MLSWRDLNEDERCWVFLNIFFLVFMIGLISFLATLEYAEVGLYLFIFIPSGLGLVLLVGLFIWMCKKLFRASFFEVPTKNEGK